MWTCGGYRVLKSPSQPSPRLPAQWALSSDHHRPFNPRQIAIIIHNKKNRGMSPASGIRMRRADFLQAQPVANYNYYQFASWHFVKKTSQSFRISNNSSLYIWPCLDSKFFHSLHHIKSLDTCIEY